MIPAELLQKILANLPQTGSGSSTPAEKYLAIDENKLQLLANGNEQTLTAPTTTLSFSSEQKSSTTQMIDGEKYRIVVAHNFIFEEQTPDTPAVEIKGAEVITVYKMTDGNEELLGAVTVDPRINIALRDPRGYVERARKAEENKGPDLNEIMGILHAQGYITQATFENLDAEIVSVLKNDTILKDLFHIDNQEFYIPSPESYNPEDFEQIKRDQDRIEKLIVGDKLFDKKDQNKFEKEIEASKEIYSLAFAIYGQNAARPIEGLVQDRYTQGMMGDDEKYAPKLSFVSKTAVISFQTIKNKQYCIVVEKDLKFIPTSGSTASPIRFNNAEVMTVFEITPQGYLSKGSYTSDPRLKAVIKDPVLYACIHEIDNYNGTGILVDAAKALSTAIKQLSDAEKELNSMPIHMILKAVLNVLYGATEADDEEKIQISTKALTDICAAIDMLEKRPEIEILQSQQEEAIDNTFISALSVFAGVLIIALAIYISVQTAGLGVLIGAPLSQFGLTLLGIKVTATAGVALAAGSTATVAGTYYGFKNYRESQALTGRAKDASNKPSAPEVIDKAEKFVETIKPKQ